LALGQQVSGRLPPERRRSRPGGGRGRDAFQRGGGRGHAGERTAPA